MPFVSFLGRFIVSVGHIRAPDEERTALLTAGHGRRRQAPMTPAAPSLPSGADGAVSPTAPAAQTASVVDAPVVDAPIMDTPVVDTPVTTRSLGHPSPSPT